MAHGNAIIGMAKRFGYISLDAAFPRRCLYCESLYHVQRSKISEPDEATQGVQLYGSLMSDFLCSECLNFFNPIESPLCTSCGRPFISREGVDHRCHQCLKRPFAFETARAAGVYDQALKGLIQLYKYHGRSELAFPLANLLWDAAHRFYGLKQFDTIVPVPLHWFRLYKRGFNQTEVLLRQWAKIAAKKGTLLDPEMICMALLYRRRYTAPQTGLDPRERAANLKSAFAVNKKHDVKDKRVLIVDDVMTTGVTVNECAKVLKRAGAESVHVLTLSRAT